MGPGGPTAARLGHALARGAAALRGELRGAQPAGQLGRCFRGCPTPFSIPPSTPPLSPSPLLSTLTTDTAGATAQPHLQTCATWRHLVQVTGKARGVPLAEVPLPPTPCSGNGLLLSLEGLLKHPPAKAQPAQGTWPGSLTGGCQASSANTTHGAVFSRGSPTGGCQTGPGSAHSTVFSTATRAPQAHCFRQIPASVSTPSAHRPFAGAAGALRGGPPGVCRHARSSLGTGATIGTGSSAGAAGGLQGAWGRQHRSLSSAAYGRQWAYGAPGGDSALLGLMLVNGLVFVAWNTLDQRFMSRHFLVSTEALRRGRWYTLVTSVFSHKDMGHLLPNLVTLYFFGKEVGMYFGGPYLVGLYLAGGVVGSLAHVAFYSMASPRRKGQGFQLIHGYSPPALGASGAVNAIVLFNCLLEPFRIVYLNMFLPMPSIVLGLLFIAQDLYGAAAGTSRVGHAAHLGGAAVGVLAYLQYILGRGRFR